MDTETSVFKPAQVLLVDDSRSFCCLVEVLIGNSPLLDLAHIAEDGVEAMAFLRREGPYVNARLPDLVLPDINMPKKNGFEVLKEIRRDPRLRKLPVIILTTSSAEGDIEQAYDQGANTFITKPVGIGELEWLFGRLAEYWVMTAQLSPPVLRKRGFRGVAPARAEHAGSWPVRGRSKRNNALARETDSTAPFRGLPHATGSAVKG